MLDLLTPDWPVPPNVKAFFTLRSGGVSQGVYASLNLGDHVGDDPRCVAENRRRVASLMPSPPLWLQQVHGIRVLDADQCVVPLPEADGAVSRCGGRVCAVMAADCLPVLLCDRGGNVVAAAHAGWRGLAAGILGQAVAAMGCPPQELLAWLGPAIGPRAFEVGEEVRDALDRGPATRSCFQPAPAPGKWLADLPALARLDLARSGVQHVFGGELCTFSSPLRFFSHRRDGCSGRMGAFIWLEG